jgi:outer membrane protein assembly factor BamB
MKSSPIEKTPVSDRWTGRWGKSALFFLLIAYPVWFFWGRIDHGEANLFTAICLLLGMVAATIWLIRTPAMPRLAKFSILAIPVSVFVICIARYRYVGFSGELVPQFRSRFSESPGTLESVVPLEAKTADATNLEGDFTQFLGNDRTGIVSSTALSSDWSVNPPKILWKQPIGPGWSGFAVKNNMAFTLEEFEDNDCAIAWNASTGKPIWRTKLGGKHFNALGGGGPRSTPTIAGDRVFVQSSTGIVAALQLNDGKLLWSVDLFKLVDATQAEAEAAVSWGRSGSPLVVGDGVVVPLGGKSTQNVASLIAFHSNDGTEKWRAGTDQISYSSPSLMSLHGVQQIVIVNEKTVSGHRLDDGTELWQFEFPGQSNAGASVSQTIRVDEERLFLSKSYHVGARLLDFSKSSPIAVVASEVWKKNSVMKTKFTNAVLINGYVYGLSDGIMECIRVDDGERMWKENRNGRFGHGQILAVGEHILVSTEDGRCVLLQASPEKMNLLGEVPVLEGTTWNPLAIVGDRVFLRNGQQAACLQVPIANR